MWDVEGVPPEGAAATVLWSSFAANGNAAVQSLPKRVEERAEEYRARYLAWIHELGESVIDGKALRERLELRPGFSYWWMTSLAQKFNAGERSHVNDAIKLLALEELVREKDISSINLVSANVGVTCSLRRFCRASDIAFTARRADEIGGRNLGAMLRRLVPAPLRALLGLVRYTWERARLRETTAPANGATVPQRRARCRSGGGHGRD